MIRNPIVGPETVKKEGLTKAVQEELLLVEAFPGTSAYTSAKEETETKPVFITAVVKTKAEAVYPKVKLEIDGKLETLEWPQSAATAAKIPFSFLVKRAGKWKMTIEASAESIVIARQALTPV